QELDLHTCTLADTAGLKTTFFTLSVLPSQRPVSAFAGWFDVFFKGTEDAPLKNPVTLSTSPTAGYTHWGQQV
ncbi:unnamed protein product, partial [Choristocarpus tenellus]